MIDEVLSFHNLLPCSGGLNKSGAMAPGPVHIRRGSPLPTSVTRLAAATRHVSASVIGVREMLTSLGLLCLLSLMMALLGLVFLMKMNPPPDAIHFVGQVRVVSPDEAAAVYEVSVALCSLGITLDVCCCLVCATQLLFAARLITASTYSASNSSRERLVRSRICFLSHVLPYLHSRPLSRSRIKTFLRDSAVTRICAVAGFFVSIPVFLTGLVFLRLPFPLPALTFARFSHRYRPVHDPAVPLDAGHLDEHSDQCGNRAVRMRHAPQHRRLAKGTRGLSPAYLAACFRYRVIFF